jgi:DNA-binding sugar fermentation-stimulating protein
MILREDAVSFRPNAQKDPMFSNLICNAHHKGVKILAYKFSVSNTSIDFISEIPVIMP